MNRKANNVIFSAAIIISCTQYLQSPFRNNNHQTFNLVLIYESKILLVEDSVFGWPLFSKIYLEEETEKEVFPDKVLFKAKITAIALSSFWKDPNFLYSKISQILFSLKANQFP